MRRTKRGKYEIEERKIGGYLIYGARGDGTSRSLPSDEKILETYRKEGESIYVKNMLKLRGVVESGKFDIRSGREAIGIPKPEIDILPTTLKECEKAIRRFWPNKKVGDFFEGKKVKLKSLTKFAEEETRAWASIHRVHGRKVSGTPTDGFRKVMETVYPGLYDRIYRGGNSITSKPNEEKLGRKLLEKFKREPISKSHLRRSKSSEDNKLYREVIYIARDKGISYTKAVELLTGLKERDITSHQESRKLTGILTEEMTRFIVLWSKVMGIDVEALNLKEELYMGKQERTLRNGQDYLADLRLGNEALEVKCGLGELERGTIEKVKHVYKVNESQWADGKTLDGATVVFYQAPHLYKSFKRDLQKQGIQVLGFKWSENLMKKIVRNLKRSYTSELEDVRPRANLDYLLESHREISLNPRGLYMLSNIQRLQWTIDQFRGLNKKGGEIYESA